MAHLLPCKLLVTKNWLLPIFDWTGLGCPQVYFIINVKNTIFKLKTEGFPGLCSCCMFANPNPRWWPWAPVASHQAWEAPCGQSSQVSVGRQQVSNTNSHDEDSHRSCHLPAQTSDRMVLAWSFASHGKTEAELVGLIPDKGGRELLTECQSLLRSSCIAVSSCAPQHFCSKAMRKPPFPTQLPNTTRRWHWKLHSWSSHSALKVGLILFIYNIKRNMCMLVGKLTINTWH